MTDIPRRELFEEWLRSKPEDDVIADKWGCANCPIAIWLKDTDWDDDAIIQSNDTSLPQWAQDFVFEIDGLNYKQGVTSRDCLNVLASIIQ